MTLRITNFHVSYVVYTLPFRPHCTVSCGHDSISQQTPAPPWHWAAAIFTWAMSFMHCHSDGIVPLAVDMTPFHSKHLPLHDIGHQQFSRELFRYRLPFRLHCTVSCGQVILLPLLLFWASVQSRTEAGWHQFSCIEELSIIINASLNLKPRSWGR
jgi:hypothetical protein